MILKFSMCDGDNRHKSDGRRRCPPAAFTRMFKFATIRDTLLMIVGFTCSVIHGLRLLIFSLALPHLFSELSFSDLSLTYAEMDRIARNATRHNSTSGKIVDEFGSSSLDAMFSEIFYTLGVVIGIWVVVQCSAYYAMTTILGATSLRQANRALDLYLESLMRQDVTWFDDNHTGKLLSQTFDDFKKFQDGIGVKLGLMVSSLAAFFAPIVYCAYLNWKLTLIIVSFLPVYLISFKILATSRTVHSKRESDECAKAGSIAEEVLSNIKTVVSFGGQRHETERFESHVTTGTKADSTKALVASMSVSLFIMTICSSVAVAVYCGTIFTANNGIDAMSSSTMIIYILCLSAFRLGETFGHIDAILHARSSCARILNIIDQLPTKNSTNDDCINLTERINRIAFKDVSFSYPARTDVKILDNFNLEVKSGETIAVVGESGSGKSTLINLLLRYYNATDGSVLLNDTDVRRLSPQWLRTQIGYVGQEPVLFPTTIAENIGYGKPGATPIQIENAARLANAHDFVNGLPEKYETPVGDRGAHLSGGQKQRIAIARALIREPQILVLDEATSALDSRSEAVVNDSLQKTRRGRTTFVIAHRLSTVRNADRIVFVSAGKIVESGTHDQLMTNPQGFYRGLITKQDLSDFKQVENDATLKQTERERVLSIISLKLKNGSLNLAKQKHGRTCTIVKIFRLGRWNSFLLAFGMVGSVAFGVVFVVFNLDIVPRIISVYTAPDPDESNRALVRCVVFMAVCAVAFVVSTLLQLGFLGVAAARIGASLRLRAFSSLLKQEMSFFDDPDNGVGRLCLMLSLDVNNVKDAIGVCSGIILVTVSQLIFSSGASFSFAYQFGLVQVSLMLGCLMLAVGYHIVQKKKETATAVNVRHSSELLRQIVTNIRTVFSFCLEAEFHDKLITYHGKKIFAAWKQHLQLALGALIEASAQIGFLVLLLAMPTMLRHNDITIANFFRAFGIVSITNGVARSIAVIPNFVAALTSLQRIFDVIDLKADEPLALAADGHAPPFSTDDGSSDCDLVQFGDVSFSYPTRMNTRTLKRFTLDIGRGQTVALVGGSGCGKSTCVQLLERFYEPDCGRIRFAGRDIASIDVNLLRKEMALVQQEPALFDRTVAENIAYGDLTRSVTMEEIVDAAIVANAHDFVAELPQGYETRVGERGTQLSGGQKQRIAIARALMRKSAKIMLLDEATSALDVETEKNVQYSLKKNRAGTTFLVVAHRLSTIVDADVIVVIDRGRIVETGTHAELMAKQEHYFRLHQQHLHAQAN